MTETTAERWAVLRLPKRRGAPLFVIDTWRCEGDAQAGALHLNLQTKAAAHVVEKR